MSANTPDGVSRHVILVLGMHRSGTSAVTRVLNLLGAQLGGALIPPGSDNPKGFWELAAAVRINDELLQRLGRTWYDMREMPPDWVESEAAHEALSSIGRVIREDFGGQTLSVIKDPRLCLTARLWIAAFRDAGFEVSCVFVVRDPEAVVDSLHLRNEWPRAQLFLMWAQYLMEAAAATVDCPRTMISYEATLVDWRGEVRRAADELGLTWPVDVEAAASDIDGFLERHGHGGRGREVVATAAAARRGMPDLVLDLYKACMVIVGGKGDWTSITKLRETLRPAAELYDVYVSNLLAERWASEAKAQRSELSLAEAKTAIDQSWSDRMDSVNTTVAGVAGRLDEVLAGIADARSQGAKCATDDLQAQALAQRLDALSGSAAETSAQLTSRLNEVCAQVARTEEGAGERLARVEQRIDGLVSSSEIEPRMQALARRVDTLGAQLNEAGARVDRSGQDAAQRLNVLEERTGTQSSALSALELRWQRRVDRQERLLQALHRKVEQLEPMLVQKLDEGYADLCRRDDALGEELADVQRERDRHLQEVRLEREEELAERIRALTSSTSWKVTAPMRWLRTLFRRRPTVVK